MRTQTAKAAMNSVTCLRELEDGDPAETTLNLTNAQNKLIARPDIKSGIMNGPLKEGPEEAREWMWMLLRSIQEPVIFGQPHHHHKNKLTNFNKTLALRTTLR
ncbi:hypothetical protein MGYG_00218 [Nannizzia gypsea CBS 118893]|uniref:Uncharacterized protein n=1 Tax=Arthroderma gypseum (strain ATCC MYA-4604 / CBS 118893) TaxID=535722 RepID=E5R3Q0_ARTGP|nr:hypothetical protein MGYG_00218 [Nannizzia gypsea CBS 118893]EFQ97174.1 hypothetical protein MGYG_00218 [Nannizzia gypsea CBS 118893]